MHLAPYENHHTDEVAKSDRTLPATIRLMKGLRLLQPEDLDQLICVYRDAVLHQATGLYSPAQISAWAEHGERSNVVADSLRLGHGVASYGVKDPKRIEAFGILAPADRLALLYCRTQSCRQGRASAILAQLERHAQRNGVATLRTEASQLSLPLLVRRGWRVETEETVQLNSQWFVRWRMISPLLHHPARDSQPNG